MVLTPVMPARCCRWCVPVLAAGGGAGSSLADARANRREADQRGADQGCEAARTPSHSPISSGSLAWRKR
ncbi:hypothetical protein LLS1_35080 [Leifsonia sp. LS1]|nr:hypothetical protein LLS1_35080 [Leifsonia sp. LS1]